MKAKKLTWKGEFFVSASGTYSSSGEAFPPPFSYR